MIIMCFAPLERNAIILPSPAKLTLNPKNINISPTIKSCSNEKATHNFSKTEFLYVSLYSPNLKNIATFSPKVKVLLTVSLNPPVGGIDQKAR